MSTYSTAPFTDPCKIVANNLYMQDWLKDKYDLHVKLFRRFQIIGGYAAFCADFYRRRGYHYRSEDGQ